MKRKIISIFAILLSLTACQTSTLQPNMYTNLYGEEKKEELVELFDEYSISKQSQEEFFSLLDDFNERIIDETSLASDYTKLNDYPLDYSLADIEPLNTFETNCRLSAYSLAKDFITTEGIRDFNDTFLMFDEEMLLIEPLHKTTEEDINKFKNFFGSVNVSGLETLDEHINAIKDYHKEMMISLNFPENMHIVNVYLHSIYDDLRFVGHTGILFYEGDTLLFLEKFGPYTPFQMTTFESEKELLDYLLSRKDLYGDPEEIEPIVFLDLDVIEVK